MRPPRSRRALTVDGSRREVDVFSTHAPAPAPVVVLVHGIGMSHRYFARLHDQLSGTATVHSIDLPGFGATPHPERALSVEDHARVLAAAIDDLGVTSCTVIGHSMGTQFAVELARQRPDLAERVALLGPVVDPRRRTVVRQALSLGLDSLREPPSANWLVFTDYLRCGPAWYLRTLPSMMDYPTEERIRDVACPVLVLRGERDPIAHPEFCRQLAATAPRGRMLQLPNHAHVLQHSAPRSVAAALIRFIAEEEPAPRPQRVPPARGVGSLIARAWWWTIDYAYAGWWQVRALLPGARPARFTSGERRPVVVIPGVYETWRFMQPLVSRLHAAGHPVHVMPNLRHNLGRVQDAAALVAAQLEQRELHDVVVVAHSKGGLIGKALMLDPRVAGRVTAMVAVSTPFSGSRYARLFWVPSLRSFSPYSPTTVQLGRERGVNSRIRSLFGVFDPHIPEGSELPGAENVRVPVGGHFRILAHPRTVELVLDAAANGVGAP
nr:alpha/beta fold hydrolase [Salinibacterium sp.]